MKIIKDGGKPDIAASAALGGRELTFMERMLFLFTHHIWHWGLRLWLPRLVWIGDEIDVRIVFPEDPIIEENEFGGLFIGGFYDIEERLREMGISFDRGCGRDGRDWEWDYSLTGPISVKFKGRSQKPEKRMRQESRRPTLVTIANQ